MRTVTTVTNVYKFEELSPDAQEHALDTYREWLTDDPYWYTCIEDDWIDKLTSMGVNKPVISFSGFWNQGDGAVFTSNDIDLIKLIDSLGIKSDHEFIYDLIYQSSVDVSANINRTSTYYDHERTARLTIDLYLINDDFDLDKENYFELETKVHNALMELEKHLESWRFIASRELYSDLMQEYELLQSDDVLKETFIENEYEFLEDGTMYH